MTKPCAPLRSNTEAHKLCRSLIQKRQVPLAKLDSGVTYVKFKHITKTNPSASPLFTTVAGTKGNRRLEEGEIYKWALQTNMLQKPWLLDGKTTHRVKTKTKKIKTRLIRTGFKPITYRFNKSLALRLVSWLVLSRRLGGLGIKPVSISPQDVRQERTALELLRTKNPNAHCTELSYILYETFRIAGLQPRFLLVYKDEQGDVSLTHVCVGVRLNPNKPNNLTPIDLTVDRKKWIGTPHKKLVSLSEANMLSIYFVNKAVSLFNKSKNKQNNVPTHIRPKMKANFLRSIKYSPRYPLALYNMALFHRYIEPKRHKMLNYLKRTLKLYPKYKEAREQFNLMPHLIFPGE